MKFNYDQYINNQVSLPEIPLSMELNLCYNITSIDDVYRELEILPLNVSLDIRDTFKQHNLECEELEEHINELAEKVYRDYKLLEERYVQI